MNECNESGGAVDRTERHNGVGPLCGIGASKCQFHLRFKGKVDLMITHGGIEQPHPKAAAKCKVNGVIALGNRICDRFSDCVERDVVDTELPHKIFDVANMLLVRLGRKKRLKKPFTIMDLPDVTKFFEGTDAFAHNRGFTWSIMDLLDSNRTSGACIHGA